MAQVFSPFLSRLAQPAASGAPAAAAAPPGGSTTGLGRKRRLAYPSDDECSVNYGACGDTGHGGGGGLLKRMRASGAFDPAASSPAPAPFGLLPQHAQQQQQQQQQHAQHRAQQQHHLQQGYPPLDPLDRPQYSARALQAEVDRAQQESRRELDRTREENRILKRAVAIQNGRCRELETQLAAAQAHAKRQEQLVYALSVRVQAQLGGGAGGGGAFLEQRAPDVF